MRLAGWQMITRLTVRRRPPGRCVLVWMLSVSLLIFFEVSDGRISRWLVELDVIFLEENSAEPAPAAHAQRESQAISQGSREIDDTQAYLRQFEQWGGNQWLPHSY